MDKEMLNTKEVAKYLNINEKLVYRLIKEKRIPGTRVTGKWTFPKRLIDEWIVESAKENVGLGSKIRELKNHIVIMGSNDFTIELLSHNSGAGELSYCRVPPARSGFRTLQHKLCPSLLARR